MGAGDGRAGDTGRQESLLPPDVLERLGGLDLIARTIVRGFVSGAHRSPFLGSGEDFSRHRAYQQGDDVRRLDWRLYGRTDRLYVRLFEENSNLQAFLLVDRSESMAFSGGGAVSKLRYAHFVAAALTHLMLRSGDAVGLASTGERTGFHLPARNRPGHLHDMLLTLERMSAGGTGSVAAGIDEVGAMLPRRGRLVVLSDCLEEGSAESLVAAVGRQRARGHEVFVLRVATEVELGLRSADPGRYYDPERPERVIPAAPEAGSAFSRRVAAYYETLRAGIEEAGAEYVALTTAQPLVPALGQWLRARSHGERAPEGTGGPGIPHPVASR